jgi:hypothetical protein
MGSCDWYFLQQQDGNKSLRIGDYKDYIKPLDSVDYFIGL